MKKEFWLTCISACLLAACCEKESLPVTPTSSDLQFGHLAKTWDEGIPLGNATVGTLVWQFCATFFAGSDGSLGLAPDG